MSARVPFDSMKSAALGASRVITSSPCDIGELISLALRGLRPMFDADRQLFCHRLVRTDQRIVREGLSLRYTLMTLLGLREVELAGTSSGFNVREICEWFIRDTKWIQGIGDLGLLIWLAAAFDSDRVADVLETFNCETALDRYSDAREGRTMELAWFLAGLSHAAETSPTLLTSLTDLSVETYHRIEENQGEYDLFGHMGVKKSLTGRFRGKIGSFADQVYPIYAMSKFAKVFQVDDPLGPALGCATAICSAQGELGQWWWLYDSTSGRTSSRYPVYSVHQHAMAPMCLFAVEGATGQSFRSYIYKGLSWIYGSNELEANMRDHSENLIWRCILPKRSKSRYWEMATSILRPPSDNVETDSLKVLYEQRPYEYGWLLFAFARHAGDRTVVNPV